MNHKKHIQRAAIFLFVILFVYSCIQDDSQSFLPENNQGEQTFTTKRVYFDEIENKEVIQQKINRFFDKNNSHNYRSKRSKNNKNYILDTEKIAYIEDETTHSYTMQLIDLDVPYKLINLLLSSSDGENYDMYLVEYNISEEEKQQLIEGKYVDLSNKVTFIRIDENDFGNLYQTNSLKTDEICYEIEVVEGVCASGQHGHGDESCSFLGTNKEAPPTYFVITAVDCGAGGGGGGGYFPPTGGSPWEYYPPDGSFTGYNPPSPPLGGGGNIKNPPKNTTPVRNFTRFDSFSFSLDIDKPELATWLNNPQNSEIKEQIKSYINSNSFIIGPSMQEQLNKRYEFVEWAIQFFIDNPDTTWDEFKNWFMGEPQGDDYFYDDSFWNNPANLNFQQQPLPSYNDFHNGFKDSNGKYFQGADNIYNLVGGAVKQVRIDYPGKQTENTCALRMSIALNYSGVIIPNISGQTIEGEGDYAGKYFFLNARALRNWMRETFGTSDLNDGLPDNIKHISFTAQQTGEKGINLPNLVKNKKGIYAIIIPPEFEGVSGHVDILRPNGTCPSYCNFQLPVERVDIWILD